MLRCHCHKGVLVTLALAITYPAAHLQAQSAYTFVASTVAGTTSRGVNDQAHVVGYIPQPDGSERAFYWTGTPSSQPFLLPSFAGSPAMDAAAYGINNSDVVVGYQAIGSPYPGGSTSHGFLWHPGDAALTDLNGVETVLTSQGWEITDGDRVNDSGLILAEGQHIIGYDSTGAPIFETGALLLTPSITNPGYYTGAVISDPSAQQAGSTDLSSNGYALLSNPIVFYNGSTLTPISGYGGGNGGINASAEIVGSIQGMQNIHVYVHAAYWSSPTASALDLGVFGGYSSFAYSINDSHVIVGFSTTNNGANHAFRWRPGDSKITDLNAFLPKGTNYTLQSARRISPAGVITGQGANGTVYVLIPSKP